MKQATEPTTLSVLVCTYNRADMLNRCLSALIDRTNEKPNQVVVVNGGDNEADAVVNDYVDRADIEVKLVKTINKNLAASRNVGLPHCTGQLIAMTDDDAEVFPDWITRMKRVHREHPEAGAVGGEVIGADNHALISRIADEVTFKRHTTERKVRNLPGVNVSYKREVVQAVGPQDETLFRGEDVDYNWRIKQLGYEIIYHPAVRVLHHHRSTFRSFLKQHYMYGRAYYLVRRKWPEMYSIYPREFRRPKDLLKAVNFIAGIFYEPAILAPRVAGATGKLAALPVLLVNGFAWRGGMIRQFWMERAGYAKRVTE